MLSKIGSKILEFLNCQTVLQAKLLTEQEHRERSSKIKKMILPFVENKERFLYLAEGIECYFDFQRVVEFNAIIKESGITLVTSTDTNMLFVYHDGELIGGT